MMDPLFGLPCINESRAMDNARNRNFIAEKNLAHKFESLDLARKSVSGKLLTSRSTVGDFLESLDLNACRYPRRSLRDKRVVRSMSLRELDKRMTEAKDRKGNLLQSPIQTKKFTTTAKAANPNSTIVLKKEHTVLSNTFDSDSTHIVHLEKHPRCLPINRQKHAMRGAYERATTEDVHYKRQRAPPGQTPRSFSPQRGYDKLLCDSPIHSSRSSSHVKQPLDRKRPM